jgi:hypothetical protein
VSTDRSDSKQEPQTRRERLAAIAAEYSEENHEPRTQAQLNGAEPVSRLAAIVSEGSIESSRASHGRLIVADTPGELAERLRQEAAEGAAGPWPRLGSRPALAPLGQPADPLRGAGR